MIDHSILAEFATSSQMLETAFTIPASEDDAMASPVVEQAFNQLHLPGEDEVDAEEREAQFRAFVRSMRKVRSRWEDRIESKVREGLAYTRRNYNFYMAADLAFDDKVVPERVPLMLYAQGKIKISSLVSAMEALPIDRATKERFFKKSDNGEVAGINLTAINEIGINLVRPYIRRRLAAQVDKYHTATPPYKYEPRDNTMKGKLKAAALTQRVSILAEQYGWKAGELQEFRNAYLYAHSASFKSSDWEEDCSLRLNEAGEKELVVEREGFSWVTPHPSRVFWDQAHPLSAINTDTGPNYIGFWDVVRVGAVRNDPAYWNRKEIRHTDTAINVWNGTMAAYRDVYYPAANQTINRSLPSTGIVQIGEINERKGTLGYYAQDADEYSMIITHYYEKVIPKNEGLGNYPYPVWLHLIVANDSTVVFAEIMSSTPCVVTSYDENDGRLMSMSMAHEIMPYQDHIQQMLDQVVRLMKLQGLCIIAINSDMVKSDEFLKAIKEAADDQSLYTKPLVAQYSFSTARDLAASGNGRQLEAVQTFSIELQLQISTLLSGIGTLTTMLEKNQMFSPQEMGQFVTKEAVATEVIEVSKTTNALTAFTSAGIDAARAAKKRIAYESLVANSTRSVPLPVIELFPDQVIKDAGFIPAAEDAARGSGALSGNARTIIGDPKAMVYSYTFDDRDGVQRPNNPEIAKALVQLLDIVTRNPTIAEKMGDDELRDMVTEIFRLAGSGFVLKLSNQGNAMTMMQQLQQAVQQINQQVQQNQGNIAGLQQALQQMAQAIVQRMPPEERPQVPIMGQQAGGALPTAGAPQAPKMQSFAQPSAVGAAPEVPQQPPVM